MKGLFESEKEKFGFGLEHPTGQMFFERSRHVRFAVECIMLAYAAVFNKLNEYMLTPMQWLLVQLFPNRFLGKDFFQILAVRLFNKCDINSIAPSHMGTAPFMYYVLDEANVCMKDAKWSNFFFSSNEVNDRNSPSRRSFLTPAIKQIRDFTGRPPIISGTGLSMLLMHKPILSCMQVASPLLDIAFIDFPRLQVDDVERILRQLINATDHEIKQASRWLEGRPRFTTAFLDKLWKIANAADSAHE